MQKHHYVIMVLLSIMCFLGGFMSGSIIPTPDYKADNWQNHITQVEKQRLGFFALSLTNYDNNSVPQIAAGSVVEISGSLFQFSSNDSIGGTPSSDNVNYIMLEVSGSGDSQTVAGTWTTTAPTWNDAKKGYYDAGGTKRYVGECYYDGTNYQGKTVYPPGSRRLIRVLPIGDWNMDSTSSVDIAHSLDWENIRAVSAIIINDDNNSRYMIAGTGPSGGYWGGVGVGTGNITLFRASPGMFDSTMFNSTSFNRGWITIWHDL
jgi:hypothetical protein